MSLETQNLFLLEIYEMYTGIYDKKISIIFIKTCLERLKSTERTQGVLGLTLWVCSKASKVYPVLHNRIPARTLVGARSYWKHGI